MLAGLVVGIILGVVAAFILLVVAYRYLYLRRQRRKIQVFHLPPPVTTRSLESFSSSGPLTPPAMSELPHAVSIIPHLSQNFASEVPVPVIPEAEPMTPLSEMFSPYTNSTTTFSELAHPVIQKAPVRTPQVSEQPISTISRTATELQWIPSPITPPNSRPFSPATVSSIHGSICETPVVGTAVAFNMSRESLPRYSMIRIDNEQATELPAPRTAYIPYRPPQGRTGQMDSISQCYFSQDRSAKVAKNNTFDAALGV